MTHMNNYHSKLVSVLDIRPGMRVLDLGCGSGASLPSVIEALAHNGAVVAADRNKTALLDIAKNVSAMAKGIVLETRCIDVSLSPLPFETDSFDRILCQNVIECIDAKHALLSECHRILKPGGLMLLSHHDFDTAVFNSDFKELNRQLIHGFADTTQAWQDVSDGQIGRKLFGLIAASNFGAPVRRETMLIEEHSFTPQDYGFNLSTWVFDIARKSGTYHKQDLENWRQDLRQKADDGGYYFCICLMAAVGEKRSSS